MKDERAGSVVGGESESVLAHYRRKGLSEPDFVRAVRRHARLLEPLDFLVSRRLTGRLAGPVASSVFERDRK